jgi:hypothetical protein
MLRVTYTSRRKAQGTGHKEKASSGYTSLELWAMRHNIVMLSRPCCPDALAVILSALTVILSAAKNPGLPLFKMIHAFAQMFLIKCLS